MSVPGAFGGVLTPEQIKEKEALAAEFVLADGEMMKAAAKLHAPIYERRAKLTSAIDGFWWKAIRNCESVNTFVDDVDVEVFSKLKSLDVERSASDPRKCIITFEFAPNDYLADDSLTLVKTFNVSPEAGELGKTEYNFVDALQPTATEVRFKSEDKDLAKKRPTVGGDEEDDDSFEPGSFFSCFFRETRSLVANPLGYAIAEELWPNAIAFFQAELSSSDIDPFSGFGEFDDDDDEDSEEDSEEDESDLEDPNAEISLGEEDDDAPPKKKAKSNGK